jgi:proteasome accessory factor C
LSPRLDAEVRLRRLLAVLPWIAQHQGVTVDAIAARFGIPAGELEQDLLLLPMCGLPPYTADRLIDLQIDDDGSVTVRFAEYFSRPLRLTREEGVAVAVAGRALLAVPGADDTGPLARALAKLEALLGPHEAVVDVDQPARLAELRAAATNGESVDIEYHSFNRDAITSRRIDPHAVFSANGAWYVDAYCHLAADDRLFRVDRVRQVQPTGERFAPPTDKPPASIYHPRPDDPRVIITLPARARWVAESYPVEKVEDLADGRLRVRLAVSARPFLERLLLRVGADAVVEAPADQQAVGREAAERIRARYGTG